MYYFNPRNFSSASRPAPRVAPSKATRGQNPSPRRHLLLLRPLPSPSPEVPAGQAREAGEGGGGDLLSELLVRRLGGELPGGEQGSASGCCSGLPPSPSGVGCGEGGWSAPAASVAGLMDSGRRPLEGRRRSGGGRRPLGAAGRSLGCVDSEVSADVGRAGVPDLRPDLKMVAPSRAARHTPQPWSTCPLRRLVGGAGDGGDWGKPLAAGGGHDVDGATGVVLLPEGDFKVFSPLPPQLACLR
jgi:hypothetical protein